MMSLMKPYRGMIVMLVLLSLVANAISLYIPLIISAAIDAFTRAGSNVRHVDMSGIVWRFAFAAAGVFLFTWLQNLVQVYTSERVARDLRGRLSDKISRQSAAFLRTTHPSQVLTNLTSDVDSIKLFVSQAIQSIASSIVIIVGASIMLLSLNWRLGLCVMAIIPIIGGTFFFVLKKVRAVFLKARTVVDTLNKVINESILGSAIIRVLNAQGPEYLKFMDANQQGLGYGLQILRLFAGLIPVIVFTANLAALTILALGGHYVIIGKMSLGNFTAFMNYLQMLIFPILVIGFMSNVIAQASAAFFRISGILNAQDPVEIGELQKELQGDIRVEDVTVAYGEKVALKDISFHVAAGSRTAVIGPTAAGKTQLLNLLTALNVPDKGRIVFDGAAIEEYNKEDFHRQVGYVFQDSIVFNMSIRENIAFSSNATDESLSKAIETAELKDFIESMPDKLDSIVSERGSTLSGGQKQRLMLARALAIEPKILLLDDFTARVDTSTEQKILDNVKKNYPGITLISVTQKIAAIEEYDQVILLMEGEMIASGTHAHLMETCPEYVQIYNSQRSTSHYEQHELQS